MMEEDAIAFAPTFKLKRGTDNEYVRLRDIHSIVNLCFALLGLVFEDLRFVLL